MPAFGAQGILRDDQIENITSYVLSWSSPITTTDYGYEGLPTGVAARSDEEATANAPTPDPNANPVDAGGLVFQSNCSSCHNINSEGKTGPGLGGLFSPEGTAAFGTTLPNGQPVSEDNVKAWIKGGSAGFPENINDLTGKDWPPMPGFPQLSDEQLNNLVVWLRVHDRDGNETEEAEQIRQSGNTQTESPAQPGDNLPMTPIPTGQAQPNTAPESQQMPTSQVNEGDDAESEATTAEAVDTPTP
jgi:cytochrome c oxidase cbb3-type subunit 3